MKNTQLYEQDFYAWANEQAGLLRAGKLSEADIENIAEEIESMGKTEKRELTNRLTVLLLHLLKWQYQPGLRSNSWRNSIRIQRREVTSHMADNQSLKSLLPQTLERAYEIAAIEAETETGLSEDIFSATCQWSYEQMTDSDFWPAG